MNEPRWFIEIGCLYARDYTGISQIARQLAQWFYARYPQSSFFFRNDTLLPRELVGELLAAGTGEGLEQLHTLGLARAGTVSAALAAGGPSAGIFTLQRANIRQFTHETQMVYDLSTLECPEYHLPHTIREVADQFAALPTADLSVAISAATRSAVVGRLNVPDGRTLIAYPGLSAGAAPAAVSPGEAVEPYVLVLGTIEPRKNIPLLLSLVAANPAVLRRVRLVFAGKAGWGPPFAELVANAGLESAQAAGRLTHIGFVSEPEKQALLRHAQFLAFPSWYEGFGLPVLEALAAGCPVLASNRSSIPEAGGEAAAYFDPTSVDSLRQAWFDLEARLAADRPAIVSRGRAQAARFTVDNFARAIHDRILADLARVGENLRHQS